MGGISTMKRPSSKPLTRTPASTLGNNKWSKRMRLMDDEIVPVHLRKGSNGILIKIQNKAADWNFICRLRTRER